MAAKIKKGDKVVVLAGKDKGKGGDGKRETKRLKGLATATNAPLDSTTMILALAPIAAGLLVLVVVESRRRRSSS